MAIALNVRDVMQIKVHSVPPDMLLPDLQREFIDKKVSAFPVVERGELVGVVSRSDIVRQLVTERHVAQTTSDFYWDESGFQEAPAESIEQIAIRVGQRIEGLRVSDVMSRNVVAVRADDSLELAAQKFLDHHIHRVPVVEHGRLVGILGALDLLRLFADKRVQVD